MGLIEEIASSEVFIVVGTKNYLQDIREANPMMLTQVALALDMDKPVFLFIEKGLNDQEATEIRDLFCKHRVIKEYRFDGGDLAIMDSATREIKDWLNAGNK